MTTVTHPAPQAPETEPATMPLPRRTPGHTYPGHTAPQPADLPPVTSALVAHVTAVRADAAELLLSRRVRISAASNWGPWPTVAATILPDGDGTYRRAHDVTLAYGIWECDAHRSSTCACCLAVQTVTAGQVTA